MRRSWRFATVRPSIPSPRKIETPSGSHVPNGSGSCESGRPSRRPSRRPMSRPTIAVTNSAVESASTRRISQVAGHDREVREHAEPDDHPGHHPQGDERTGGVVVAEQAIRRSSPGPARSTPRAGLPGHGYSGSTTPSRSVPAAPHLERSGRGRQPSIAGTGSPRPDDPAPSAARIASARRRDRDDLDLDRRGRPGTRRGAGHDRPAEAEPGGLAESPVEARDGAQLAQEADLADGDEAGRRPGGRAGTRRGRAPAAGRGRARRRSARRRGWRRRHGRTSPTPARRPRTASSRLRRFGSRPLARRVGEP